MEREEKIRLAITAGIAAVILLILVLVIALSGKKKSGDDEKLAESITEYADASVSAPGTLGLQSGSEAVTDAEGASDQDSSASDTEQYAEAAGSASSAKAPVLSDSEYLDTAKNAVSGNSFYATNSAVLKDVYRKTTYNAQQQMSEMYHYWSEGNMDAVRDLAHLERFEAMSYSLSGTTDFYYYGDTNTEGIPNGMGLACYAQDQYYYGQWVNGARSGDGCWISFYPNYSQYVVTEHMYTGQWAGDLPNGQGQEHYDYNSQHMNKADIYLQNMIGGFSIGNYNGNMYVITVDQYGETTEWEGSCENGNWQAVPYASNDSKGKIPVLSERENTDRHLYMTKSGAQGNGVSGIICGGNVRR